MKTIAASVGLVALSACVLSAVDTKVLNSQQDSKPWSVSASLRGFYDDNIYSAPNGSEVESAGFQVNPTLDYGFVGEQTSVNFGYALGANYYENHPGRSSKWDLTHTLEAALSHAFNPRIDVALKDSFVIGQEPDVLQMANMPFATSQVASGNRNYASIDLNLQATSLLGFQVGYGNTLYNYDDSGDFSNSARLDRMEHSIRVDSRWTLRPETIGILGYEFTEVGYTGDAVIGYLPPVLPSTNAVPIYSDERNSRVHTFSAGAVHTFSPNFSGDLRGGVQVVDYYNNPSASTEISPYVQGSLTYMYRATSSLKAGVSMQRTPSDAVYSTGGSYVLDAESLMLYGAWIHEIIPHLFSNVNGSVQRQAFNGGELDGQSDMYYRLGLSLAYEFTKHMSASVGYNYDQSDSDVASRTYNRNRVYIGVTAAY